MKVIFVIFLFSLPVVGHAKLNFSNSLQKILNRSPELRTQEEQIESLEVNKLAGQLRMAPELAVNSSIADSTLYNDDTETVSALLNWNLFRWGADYYFMQAERFGLKSGRNEYNFIYFEQERTGAFALLEVIHAARQVEILSKILKVKREAAQVAHERYKRGLVPETEVLKGEVDVSNTMARLKDAEVLLRNQKIELERLLGQTEVEISWPWLEYLQSKAARELIKREFDYEKRPDYLVALNDLKRQESLKQNAKFSILPTIDFSLERGRIKRGAFSQYETVGMITLSMPLFNGLRDYANYRANKALEVAAEQSLVAVARRAKAEVEGNKEVYQRSLDTALERIRVLKLAEKLYQRSINRFRKGRLTFNDLTVDLDRLYEAESLHASGLLEVHKALIRLCHSQATKVGHCF